MKELFWVSKDNEFLCSQGIEHETETHVKLHNNKSPIPKACIDNENKSFYGKHYFSTEQAAVDFMNSTIAF